MAVVTAHFLELCLLLFIIFVHEMGHATAGAFFSWRIKKITLLPFGGVAEMDEHGNRPLKEETIVTLAGPIQHLWMLLLGFLLYKLSLFPERYFLLFTNFNIMIFFFNLLPIWPLDGGKFVFLWLSLKKSFPEAHKMTLIVSIVCSLIFVFSMFILMPTNVNVWVIVFFLIFSIYHEWKQGRYVFIRFLLERYYGKQSDFRSLKPIIVDKDEIIIHVLERFQRGYKHPIIIQDNGKETGSLDENELLHAYFAEKQLTTKIGDLLYTY